MLLLLLLYVVLSFPGLFKEFIFIGTLGEERSIYAFLMEISSENRIVQLSSRVHLLARENPYFTGSSSLSMSLLKYNQAVLRSKE